MASPNPALVFRTDFPPDASYDLQPGVVDGNFLYLYDLITSLAATVSSLASTVTALGGTVSALQTTVSGHTTSIGTLQAQVAAVPLNVISVSAARSFSLSDLNTENKAAFRHPAADTTARTWIIPANASVAFPVGTVLVGLNEQAAGALTVALTTDTLMLEGSTSTVGNRTVAAGGVFIATKTAATVWMIGGPGVT